MKGIQKLFLGLFLVALISVGFKVETKAAAATAPTVTHVINTTTGGVDFTFTAAIPGAFPEVELGKTAAFVYQCKLYSIDDSGSSLLKTVYVELKNADGTYTIGYNTNGSSTYTSGTVTTTSATFTFESVSKAELEADIEDCTGSLVYVDANVSGTSSGEPKSGSTPCDSFDTDRVVAAGKVTLEAEFIGDVPSKTITFSPTSPVYVIKGQKKEVTATIPEKGYAVSSWKRNNSAISNITNKQDVESATNAAVTYTIVLEKDPNGFKMTDAFEGLKLLSGKESNKRRYSMSGYTFDDIASITIGGTPVKSFTDYGTTMTVTGGNAAAGKMTVRMNDGVTYDIANKAEVISKVYITLDSSYNLSPDSNYVITPGVSPDPDDITYTFTPDPSSFMTPSVDADDNLVIATKSSTGTTKVTAKATFSDIEGGTSGSAEATATATITVESLTIKDAVYVNKGLSILLSKFIKSGSSSAETTIMQYPDLIKIDPTSGKVNGIKISGESAGTKDDSLVVSTQTGKIDVTVYPSPTLSVETSTSGPYKYTVKVPKGLYHDDIAVSEVSKAVLEFKAIDHDDKTKTVTIDSLSDDSDSKLLKKGTKSIELKDLNKYIKDIAKDTDTQTIQVRAYAYNKDKDEKDDKVYSEKKEFTVYKINLDTSGNASYTVNGENVGGYFYGISDATYTIKSTATNGGKLDTTKSGDFNSGESISYKVLGARTLKAVYNASGSNANANGAAGAGMDGYDDVPKTGESRTDIWILWSVLLVSILGAGFMIWKRFGLVRAIAAADEEMAQAQEKERVEAEKKAEKDKMDMLKDLRNL